MDKVAIEQLRLERGRKMKERGWSERPDVLLVHHAGATLLF